MSLTLLIDLDDTLLQNDINVFLPHYLKALSSHLSDRYAGDVFLHHLLAATQGMVENRNPRFTAEEIFDQAFYPALNTTKQALGILINSFYQEIFPSLRKLTSPRPAAVQLIQEAIARGYQVVIATNPLFPATAIHQRLEWAGLSPREYPFALITTYENMHFTKPNPAYYAEILGQLGWPDWPAVMVGNSWTDDILPAAALGLHTFFLTGAEGNGGDPNLSPQGRLEDVIPWLEGVAQTGQAVPVMKTPASLLAMLRSTPAAIDSITRAFSTQDWQTRPADGEWAATEVVCHMRDVDVEINLVRFERIICGENPFLPGINSDEWAVERGYAQEDGPTALRQFQDARSRVIDLLEGLDEAGWNQPARHAIFGPTTLLELVSFSITHDRNHLQQIWCNLFA